LTPSLLRWPEPEQALKRDKVTLALEPYQGDSAERGWDDTREYEAH
jgi:hypothetical protein